LFDHAPYSLDFIQNYHLSTYLKNWLWSVLKQWVNWRCQIMLHRWRTSGILIDTKSYSPIQVPQCSAMQCSDYIEK
jgi:hypothetical protein